MAQKCKKCGERMALMSGFCNFIPDDEPFESGEEIELLIEVEEKIHAHYCLTCETFDKNIWIDE